VQPSATAPRRAARRLARAPGSRHSEASSDSSGFSSSSGPSLMGGYAPPGGAPAERRSNMASERFVDALNAQIAREFAAAHQYVAIGTYYAAETFPRLADFFYEQADEEREHAMKMVNYLLDRGVQADIGAVEAPRQSFGDHVEPIKLALEQEKTVTVRISELFAIARETNDYTSEQFVQWFLEEQVEEEASMDDLLTVAERTRSVPMLLEEYLARETPGKRPGD
jgi:bacterioferritin B